LIGTVLRQAKASQADPDNNENSEGYYQPVAGERLDIHVPSPRKR
jgi:hypothetical protein